MDTKINNEEEIQFLRFCDLSSKMEVIWYDTCHNCFRFQQVPWTIAFFFTWERLNLELEIAGKEVGKLKGSQLCTLFPAHADIV